MSRTIRKIPPKMDSIKVPKEIRERYKHGLEVKPVHGISPHTGKPINVEIRKEKAKNKAKRIKHKAERRLAKIDERKNLEDLE